MNDNFSTFAKKIFNRFFFKQFMLAKLPAALFAGLKIEAFNEDKAVVSVKYKWFNKNPFGSIYFAVLAMAAELSTGVLCMGNVYKRNPAVGMLLIEQKGIFHKKATSKILFTCEDGKTISETVEKAIASKEKTAITCYSRGINSNGETVAEFWITWSFKVIKSKAMPLTA